MEGYREFLEIALTEGFDYASGEMYAQGWGVQEVTSFRERFESDGWFILPDHNDIRELVAEVRKGIHSDCRCSEDPEDNEPGICLTVGADVNGSWSWQTGDNSFTGGAYHYPHWAVVCVRQDDSDQLDSDILEQLAEAFSQVER